MYIYIHIYIFVGTHLTARRPEGPFAAAAGGGGPQGPHNHANTAQVLITIGGPQGPLVMNSWQPSPPRAAPPGCGHWVQTATAHGAPRYSASRHGPGSATPLLDRRHSHNWAHDWGLE